MSDLRTITYVTVHLPTKKGFIETRNWEDIPEVVEGRLSYLNIRCAADLIAHWNRNQSKTWFYYLLQG
jgi:hypothetical protein